MTRSRAFVSLMLLAVHVEGCGSTPVQTEDEPVSLASFGLLTAEAVCSLTFQCCAAEHRRDLPETESACRARVAAELNQALLPTIETAVAAGQLRYQEQHYARCLGQVVSAGCGTARRYVDCLDEGLVPLVPAGGACSAQAHCVDAACIGATSSTPGVCSQPLADGFDCGANLECSSKACVNGVCRARVPVGRSCYADSECVSERCDGLAHVCVPPSAAMCD